MIITDIEDIHGRIMTGVIEIMIAVIRGDMKDGAAAHIIADLTGGNLLIYKAQKTG